MHVAGGKRRASRAAKFRDEEYCQHAKGQDVYVLCMHDLSGGEDADGSDVSGQGLGQA